MKNKQKKELQQEYAKKNMDYYLELIQTNKYPKFTPHYIKEVLRFSTGFNIRLKREEKLLFCKKCKSSWNSQTRIIRINKNTKNKEIICKLCNYIKKIPYK